MSVLIPMYTGDHGVHRIELYRLTPEGELRRTGQELARALRDNVVGLGAAVGRMTAGRTGAETDGPLVQDTRGRSHDLAEFLRREAKALRFVVAARPSSSRAPRVDLHELCFKPGASRQVLALFSRRYVEALETVLKRAA